ncbi:MAG: hypothetical protein ABI658_28425 [Acidimicrobiales bacterium]
MKHKPTIRRALSLTALAAVLTAGAATATANAQPETNRGVSIDYATLDALGIDRSPVEMAVAALVR